jgi:hypothetical protein
MKKYNVYIVHYTRVETKHLNNILLQKKIITKLNIII